MTFEAIIQPGQPKKLNRPRAVGAISVAVKPSVEKHVSGLDLHSTPKAGFYEGACQDDARITLPMTVAGWCDASRKRLESSPN